MTDQNTIKNLRQNGLLSEIDIHFAKFIMDFSAREDPDIFLAAALVSHATGTGDICFNLETATDHFLSGTKDFKQPIECPDPDIWREKLKASPVDQAAIEKFTVRPSDGRVRPVHWSWMIKTGFISTGTGIMKIPLQNRLKKGLKARWQAWILNN